MLEWDKYIGTYNQDGVVLLTCWVEGCGWVYSGPRGWLMAEGHLELEHPRRVREALEWSGSDELRM